MTEPTDPGSDDPTPPKRPLPIDYRTPIMDPAKLPMTGSQIAMGFACWVASVAVAVGALAATRSAPFGLITFMSVLPFAIVYGGRRVGWRGFVPGLLIGAAFSCLVPIGILGVVCANAKW